MTANTYMIRYYSQCCLFVVMSSQVTTDKLFWQQLWYSWQRALFLERVVRKKLPVFWKLKKLACSRERACRQEYHDCRQKRLPVVTCDDMTTKRQHCILWKNRQTLFSTLLALKNHTLSSTTSLQTFTLCSIKSCKSRTLSVLAWVYPGTQTNRQTNTTKCIISVLC